VPEWKDENRPDTLDPIDKMARLINPYRCEIPAEIVATNARGNSSIHGKKKRKTSLKQ
jgi:hypothetical protein